MPRSWDPCQGMAYFCAVPWNTSLWSKKVRACLFETEFGVLRMGVLNGGICLFPPLAVTSSLRLQMISLMPNAGRQSRHKSTEKKSTFCKRSCKSDRISVAFACLFFPQSSHINFFEWQKWAMGSREYHDPPHRQEYHEPPPPNHPDPGRGSWYFRGPRER